MRRVSAVGDLLIYVHVRAYFRLSLISGPVLMLSISLVMHLTSEFNLFNLLFGGFPQDTSISR